MNVSGGVGCRCRCSSIKGGDPNHPSKNHQLVFQVVSMETRRRRELLFYIIIIYLYFWLFFFFSRKVKMDLL